MVLRVGVFGVLAAAVSVALWRGGHSWPLEWLLWVTLGISAGGLLRCAEVGLKRIRK
jgi:hypothetical protein